MNLENDSYKEQNIFHVLCTRKNVCYVEEKIGKWLSQKWIIKVCSL